MRLRSAWVLGLLVIGLAGCLSGLKTVPVQGKVTVNGDPLVAGTIVFQPDPERGNTSNLEPRGSIDKQGNYKLSMEGKQGIPLGWYRVAVLAMRQPTPDSPMRPPEWLANQRFSDAKNSGLLVEVVENPATGAYNFNLEP